jgi:hypothetical protein
MYIVKGIVATGKCIACEKEVECFQVECEKHGVSGLLCAGDFRKQVKIASATTSTKKSAMPNPVQ